MFKLIRHTLRLVTAVTIVGITAGCTFDGVPGPPSPESVNRDWESASLTQPYASNRQTVYGDELFQVRHGASCAKAKRAVSEDNTGHLSYGVRVDER
jgi:hypothetical protein